MGRSLGYVVNLVALVASLRLFDSGILAEQDVRSDVIKLEQEQIFVNVLDGPTFSVTTELDEVVWGLTIDISENEGINYERMMLKLGETLLNDTRRLSSYDIQARTALTLVVPENQNRKSVYLTVKTLDGRVLQVSTHLNHSVASLKENITRWSGISQSEQRLLVSGKELKDERSLALYGIYNGTTVELGRPIEDCRQVATIFVKTMSGATIEAEVSLADTVIDLKEKIWKKTDVPTGVQRLHANGRVITGVDHLCDLGLETNSIVYMWLYSARITDLDQVARLQEPPVASPMNNYRAPIFREVEDVAEPMQNDLRHPATLFKDARNWVVAGSMGGPAWDRRRFDPVAQLSPDPDDERKFKQFLQELEDNSRSAEEKYRLGTGIERARFNLSFAVRPYRTAANLTLANRPKFPGITLGGEFAGVNKERPVTLGADVNNWAPDAFSDSDVMRLFEVAERVRLVLAKAAQTGEGILGIESQKRINLWILFTYLEALAGYPPSVVYKQPRRDQQCVICTDDLSAEPAIRLACEHAFHADCILSWVTNLYQMHGFPTCPLCRKEFMISYETLGKAELEKHELLGAQDI